VSKGSCSVPSGLCSYFWRSALSLSLSHGSPTTNTAMLLTSVIGALALLSTAQAVETGRLHNAQSVNLWKLHQARARANSVSTTSSASLSAHDSPNSGLRIQGDASTSGLDSAYAEQVAFDSEKREEEERMGKRATFPQYNFTQPLDHFYGTTNGTFPQRYWVRLPLFSFPPYPPLTPARR
jgi:hypothetical protein